jgi:hypothetical protein
MRLILYIRKVNVSDSLKACLKIVLFVDRCSLASMEKLLCLATNLPNCGWIKELSKTTPPYCPAG